MSWNRSLSSSQKLKLEQLHQSIRMTTPAMLHNRSPILYNRSPMLYNRSLLDDDDDSDDDDSDQSSRSAPCLGRRPRRGITHTKSIRNVYKRNRKTCPRDSKKSDGVVDSSISQSEGDDDYEDDDDSTETSFLKYCLKNHRHS